MNQLKGELIIHPYYVFCLQASCSDMGKLVHFDILCLLKVLSAEDKIFAINKIFVL